MFVSGLALRRYRVNILGVAAPFFLRCVTFDKLYGHAIIFVEGHTFCCGRTLVSAQTHCLLADGTSLQAHRAVTMVEGLPRELM